MCAELAFDAACRRQALERAFLGHEIGIVISVCRERGQSTPIVRPLPRVVLCCKAECGKLEC